MKRNIVNIIHFIRWTDSRHPDRNLFEPMAEQIKLAKKYGFKADILLQYDALIDEKYTNFIKNEQDGSLEIGAWFEIVQQQTQATGIEWRGRDGFSWDWYANVGFLAGYTQEQRRKLIDEYMQKFHSIFGYYPCVVGSWFMDAYSIQYLNEKYHIKAVCICRDQWGTDGYNLWGGYFNGGYFPSKHNMFCPAQTKDEQINVPLFRMLGSDPIYQYDLGLSSDNGFTPIAHQGVCTMEPIYPKCGGNPNWVNWFLDETFNSHAQPYGYVQAGQENAFGWAAMDKSLPMQWDIIKKRLDQGKIEIMHLSETGEWFQNTFDLTPAVSSCAVSDWNKIDECDRKSAWYNTRFYRVNVYKENNRVWIRDIHIFDQNYKERYLTDVCQSADCVYDNLPVVDGYRWCGHNIRSGLYVALKNDGKWTEAQGTDVDISRQADKLSVIWTTHDSKQINYDCFEKSLQISCDNHSDENSDTNDWAMILKWGANDVPIRKVEGDYILFNYNQYEYKAKLSCGHFSFEPTNKMIFIYPENNMIIFDFV